MCDLRQALDAHLQRMSEWEPDLSSVTDLKGLTASQGMHATPRGGWPSLVGLASIPDKPLRHAAAVARHRKLGLGMRDC